MARSVDREDRSYVFTCRSCSVESSRTYTVTVWGDEDGVEHDAFVRAGVPVPDPTKEPICSGCGSNRVTVLPLCHGHPVVPPEPASNISVRVAHTVPPRRQLTPRTRAFP